MRVLSDHDKQALSWLRDELDKEIAALRQRNDGNLDMVRTAETRGEIRALKNLRRMFDTAPEVRPVR